MPGSAGTDALVMLQSAGIKLLKVDGGDGQCHVTDLARQLAPDVYIEHGLCDDAHCPLNGGITNGTNTADAPTDAVGRWPWSNAHAQAATLNCTDLFRTYDMVKALSVSEVIDRQYSDSSTSLFPHPCR